MAVTGVEADANHYDQMLQQKIFAGGNKKNEKQENQKLD